MSPAPLANNGQTNGTHNYYIPRISIKSKLLRS
nr:MAG TPA: hypothetical protein [Caudoviricetes sp.]